MMSYIESIIRLIKNKQELFQGAFNFIDLSLGEIAEIWNKKNIFREYSFPGLVHGEGVKQIDPRFLYDIYFAISKLRDENLLLFRFSLENSDNQPDETLLKRSPDPLDITRLSTLDGRIYLQVIGNIDDYLTKRYPEKSKDTNRKKIKIFISSRHGIYQNEKTRKPAYQIKRSGKRFGMVLMLKDGLKEGRDLVNNFYKNGKFQQLRKEITDMNQTFRKRLELEDDLIVHVSTGGYDFNEKYDVEFDV